MFDRTPHWLACIAAAVFTVGAMMPDARAANIELPVPKITIYPGDVIGSELLTTKAFHVQTDQLPVIRSINSAVGKVARRTLIAGKPIPATYLREAELVKQGKAVRIVFTEGALTISGVAVALQSGSVGDLLSVRNSDSGTVIKGVVEEDGSVRIAGP